MNHEVPPPSPHGGHAGDCPIDTEVLDRLAELGGDDSGFVYELVEIFLEDTAERITNLGHAFESGDLEVLEQEAHTLKSSSANVGAMLLSRDCARLESQVRAGAALDDMKAGVDRVSNHHESCVRFLEGFVSNRK
jgi:HPt (histidine-containing phosphotransfer) domain-containing protein